MGFNNVDFKIPYLAIFFVVSGIKQSDNPTVCLLLLGWIFKLACLSVLCTWIHSCVVTFSVVLWKMKVERTKINGEIHLKTLIHSWNIQKSKSFEIGLSLAACTFKIKYPKKKTWNSRPFHQILLLCFARTIILSI